MRISEVTSSPSNTGRGNYELWYGNELYDMYASPRFFDSYQEAVKWFTKYSIEWAVQNGYEAGNFRVRHSSDAYQDSTEYYKNLPTPTKQKNNSLSNPEYYQECKEYWADYYGDDRRGTIELHGYIGDVDHLIEKGGYVYRVVFLEKFEDLNKTQLGSHWTVDHDVLEEYIESVAGRSHSKNKDVYVELVAHVPPNNIENLGVDVRGNPEEKEVNIINPKICKYTAQIIGTDKIIPLN